MILILYNISILCENGRLFIPNVMILHIDGGFAILKIWAAWFGADPQVAKITTPTINFT